jgi:flagellar protein FliO/FliZ
MQDRFSALLPILGAIVAFLIAALLVLYIIRLLFGRGIRSAARKGLRRLDVVDVFDLDRERQLVIVRRDNTEHLLLIGGPNDLLVEAAIAPSEASARPARDARQLPAPAVGAGWPAEPLAEPAIRPTGPTNLPPDLFAPAARPAQKPAAPEPAPASAAPPSAAAPPSPPSAAPSPPAAPPPPQARPAVAPPPAARPAAPRAATPPFLARAQRVLQPKADPAPVAPPPAPTPPPPPARPAAPPPPPPPPAGSVPPPPAPPAPAPATARPAAPPPVAPPPAPAPAPAPEAPAEMDPLESLEAEMARLLGRPDKE